MPKSEKDKREVLNRLRKDHDREELFEVVYNVEEIEEEGATEKKTRSFSEIVEYDVKTIVKKGLNKNCSKWNEICEELREGLLYTYEEIGYELNLHHSSIQDSMNTEDVDPFFLEAYALLFAVSPYELLGKEIPRAISPMSSWETNSTGYSNVIMSAYLKSKKPNRLKHLQAVTKVGKLLPNVYIEFWKGLELFGLNKRISKIDPQESPFFSDHSWNSQKLDFFHTYICGMDGDEKTEEAYAFVEACYVLELLDKRSPKRLKELAQIALCEDLEVWLEEVMLSLNYPHTHTKLKSFAIKQLKEEHANKKNGINRLGTEKAQERQTEIDEAHPIDNTKGCNLPKSTQKKKRKIRGQKLTFYRIMGQIPEE